MPATITIFRWNAIHPDYKTGDPTNNTAAILRHTKDKGTTLTPTCVVGRQQLFSLGPIAATPAALAALANEGVHPARLLARHGEGDWGDLTAQDHNTNDHALHTGERIHSAYQIGISRIWIITDAETDNPASPDGIRPRHATTLLLPSEH